MSTIRDYHSRAMELAELALVAQVQGQQDDAEKLFLQALECELTAIQEMDATGLIEPTYSVLHRSAATLALDCNDTRRAERLVAKALAQDPPFEIAEELRDLMEQINFKRHLELRGVTLEEDELQMNLTGRGVGFGLVQSEEFLSRVENASKVIFRIVERRRNRPFRERGRLKKGVKDDYEMFVSVPRAASFSVTLKLGRPKAQQKLPGILETASIVDEFLDLMDLANSSKIEAIKERIPDPAYFRNFMALAKKMAPDGDTVRQVGFTAIRPGCQRCIQVTLPAAEFQSPAVALLPSSGSEFVILKGVLRYADAIHGESGQIKVVEEGGETHTIKVPEGMMNDIVRPMWDSHVTVKGWREGRTIILEDIQEE
ncbi:MAG: tetratricopeptide repeat protein [Desulfobulbia bacterium]